MIVTDKKYWLDDYLIEKLNLMLERLKGEDDNLVIIDGKEGTGKSNIATGICYYIACKSDRKYGVKNILFSIEDINKLVMNTKDNIIHWDEGAYGALKTQWNSKEQQKFLKLLMTARIRRHFIVLCIPYFHILKELIYKDRAIAHINTYSPDGIKKGFFNYFTIKRKELLYSNWKKTNRCDYFRFRSFYGRFGNYMSKIFNKEELEEYYTKKLLYMKKCI